jgi:hypothetical protein
MFVDASGHNWWYGLQDGVGGCRHVSTRMTDWEMSTWELDQRLELTRWWDASFNSERVREEDLSTSQS